MYLFSLKVKSGSIKTEPGREELFIILSCEPNPALNLLLISVAIPSEVHVWKSLTWAIEEKEQKKKRKAKKRFLPCRQRERCAKLPRFARNDEKKFLIIIIIVAGIRVAFILIFEIKNMKKNNIAKKINFLETDTGYAKP